MLLVVSACIVLPVALGSPPILLQTEASSSLMSNAERSKALAGFQSYAESLAAKYLDKQLPENDPMRENINTVIEWIENMTIHLGNAHGIDNNTVGRCNTHFGNCVPSGTDVTTISGLASSTNSFRTSHTKCRAGQGQAIVTHNQACADYDAYRQTDLALLSKQASCALTHFSDDYIQADEDDSMLEDMESCLELTKKWFTPLYNYYHACKRTPPPGPDDCVPEQHEFEAMHCEWKEKKHLACDGYSTCVKRVQSECDVCDDINVNIMARKADYEAGQRITCLLKVLRDESDENKPDALRACTSKDYTLEIEKFDLDCAIGVPSPGLDCDSPIGPVSCSTEFLSQEYNGGASPFEHLQNCQCRVCSALNGTARPLCPGEKPPAPATRTHNFVWGTTQSNACPSDTSQLTEQECRDAASEHGVPFALMSRADMPKACVTGKKGEKPRGYYFNTHSTGGWSYFAHPICKQEVDAMFYAFGALNGNSCPNGASRLTEQECRDAAAFEGKQLRKTVDDPNRPTACFRNEGDESYYFNTHAGRWWSNRRPVCGAKRAYDTCDELNWPDNNTNIVCGDCKVRVSRAVEYSYATCDAFCARLGRVCTSAEMEEASDTCQHKINNYYQVNTRKCRGTFGHRKICECGVQATNYVFGRRGSKCTGENVVISESQCREAAEQIGFRFKTVMTNQWRQAGCIYYWPDSEVYFNADPNGASTDKDWHPICK